MELINGKFRFDGVADPEELTQLYGSPLYVYNGAVIEDQYKKLEEAFTVPDLRIHYACKALTNINILRLLKGLGAGLDAVSIQEVWIGLKAGFQPQDILYTPNCVSMDEIDLAVKEGVRINIDNISVLEHFGHAYPDYPIGIRINPHIYAGGNSKISVGHIDSKFGISIHQLPLLLKVVETLQLKIEGLHMHTGSDILDAEVFLRGAEILFQAAAHFPDLQFLDFGSGFKVAYTPNGVETDVKALGSRLSDRFTAFCEEYGRPLTLIFEPGKFLVSKAGVFLTHVNVVKTTPSTVFAGIDSGLNHLIRPMFYEAHHEIINVSNPEGKPRIYTVVGYICETDTFGINRKINDVREGDILAIQNAGAYCFSMASNYNSRFRPAEVLIHRGKHYLIRERETLEDLLNKQIEIPIFA